MKPTLRKRMNKKWSTNGAPNLQWLGMAELCLFLDAFWAEEGFVDRRALEIGSHMGEGLSMLAASGIFNKIDVIEPFAGEEPFNKEFDWDWSEIRLEWQRNTKWFDDIITLYRGYSYDLHENFKDRAYDFIYIDGPVDNKNNVNYICNDINIIPKKDNFVALLDYRLKTYAYLRKDKNYYCQFSLFNKSELIFKR